MKIIGYIHSDFSDKFGIPRQSGLVDELEAMIVMEPEYRQKEAFRGIEQFSHIWLLWQFSENERETWSPTVRPPRLGGNTRVGVFATRSPFRPNELGLSSVRLKELRMDATLGPVLVVAGADLMDGTPIYDIKPYLPYVDSHPEARDGFAGEHKDDHIDVVIPDEWSRSMEKKQLQALRAVLAQDPRPAYQKDSQRIYGMQFAGREVRFYVSDGTATVCQITDSDLSH